MVECVFVNFSGVATIAAAASLTVDNSLSVETDRSGVLKLVQNVESISEGARRALSPAGAAVARNVLVLVPGHVVASVHVSPVNGSGKEVNGKGLPRSGSLLNWAIGEA